MIFSASRDQKLPDNFNAITEAAKTNSVAKLNKMDISRKINNPNPGQFGPLHAAAELGHVEAVNYLRQYINPNMLDGCLRLNALHIAAINGHDELIRHLVFAAKMPLEGRSYTNHTALHYAIIHRQASTIKLLLMFGANPEARVQYDDKNSSAYAMAAEHNLEQAIIDEIRSKIGSLPERLRKVAKL